MRISVRSKTERISASTGSSSARPNFTGWVGRPKIDSSLSSTRIRIGTWRGFAFDQALDLLQGFDERGGLSAKVDVLDVEDLQAGLLELPVGIGVGPGVLAALPEDLPQARLGEQPPLGVSEHVELDLTNAQLGELLGERAVGVVEPFGPAPCQRSRSTPRIAGAGAMWYELWVPITWIWLSRGSPAVARGDVQSSGQSHRQQRAARTAENREPSHDP